MKRFSGSWRPFFAAIAFVCGISPAFAQQRPNIVLIVADDLRPVVSTSNLQSNSSLRALGIPPGVAGVLSETLTPNLNRLAARGTTFVNAYASCPRCNPSRAAMLTGISADVSRFYDEDSGDFRHAAFPPLAAATTLPELLRENGYYTLGFGKVFHGLQPLLDAEGNIVVDWPDTLRSWDHWEVAINGGATPPIPSPYSRTASLLSWGWGGDPWQETVDGLNAAGAADLLRGKPVVLPTSPDQNVLRLPQGQPFLLALGLAAHSPWYVDDEFLSRVPVDVMGGGIRRELRRIEESTRDLPDGALRILNMLGRRSATLGKLGIAIGIKDDHPGRRRKRIPISRYRLDVWEDFVRHYLADIAQTDACIGEILDGLGEGPYADNTIVVVVSDHGIHLGEKLHVGKTTLWDPALRSMWIISPPGGGARIVERSAVSLVDLYPTLAEAAGIETRENTRRRSLWSVVNGQEKADPGRVVISSIREGIAARLGEWKYIRYYGSGGEEFYDLKADPFEGNNLLAAKAGVPRRAQAALDKLRAVTE